MLALFLAYEFFFTGVYEARSQRALLPEFQQRLAEGGGFDSLTAPVPTGPVACCGSRRSASIRWSSRAAARRT